MTRNWEVTPAHREHRYTPPPAPPPHSPRLFLLATQVEAPGVRGIPPTSHFVQNLTCCVLNSPVAGLGMGGRVNSNSHVTVGMLGGIGEMVGGQGGGVIGKRDGWGRMF